MKIKICSDIYLEQQKGNNLQSETLNDDNVWAFLCTNGMNELQVNVCLESLHHKIGNYGPKLGAQHNPFLYVPSAALLLTFDDRNMDNPTEDHHPKSYIFENIY